MQYGWRYGQEISLFSFFAIPVLAIFTFSSRVLDFSLEGFKPYGFYTQAKLFIKGLGSSGSGQQSASATSTELTQVSENSTSPDSQKNGNLALVASFPVTRLDQESGGQYCLPDHSPLNKKEGSSPTTTSVADSSDKTKCNFDGWSKGNVQNSETIYSLLVLLSQFLKLQHTLNALILFHAKHNVEESKSKDKDVSVKFTKDSNEVLKNSENSNNTLREELKKKCRLSEESPQTPQKSNSPFKELFTSSSYSRKCYLTPVKIELTLDLNSTANSQPQKTQTASEDGHQKNSLDLDKLKEGKFKGEVQYSLANYHGELLKFATNGIFASAPTSTTPSKISSEQKPKKDVPIILSLKPTPDSFEYFGNKDKKANFAEGNNCLNFLDLFNKYLQRELKLSDFYKGERDTSKGCKNQSAASNSKK